MNLIGPFKQPTNNSNDSCFIRMKVENNVTVMERFDIVKSSHNQNKPDTVAFDFDSDWSIDKVPEQLNISIEITTNTADGISFQLVIDTHSIDTQIGAICGGIILILLNLLIITEVMLLHLEIAEIDSNNIWKYSIDRLFIERWLHC